ncbi:hypothetical protein [Shouchella shacheensis]|uniref:hypothetical protein n=1 Tax=Shouchella shacheensis TaxID=1649580 RepID=UPI000740017F|nr:hypothetical protein [Shouchella shacheensis]
MNNAHQQLIEVVVRRILQKHNVSKPNDLSDADKESIRNAVTSLQSDVEGFLQKQESKDQSENTSEQASKKNDRLKKKSNKKRDEEEKS